MFQVIKDGAIIATCIDVETAVHHIEDDAVVTWDAVRDPNASPREWAYPGLDWDRSTPTTAWLPIGNGGVEYSIIDPTPFATYARVIYDGYPCMLIEYDNPGCDYPFSQELAIWL